MISGVPGPASDLAKPDTKSRSLELVPSAEPGVVFASLAALAVPDVCDSCSIHIVDGSHGRYGIVDPLRPTAAGGLDRLLEQAIESPEHSTQVSFTQLDPDDSLPPPSHGDIRRPPGFHGVATFAWHRRRATQMDRAIVTLLVDHAVRTVTWQRAQQSARNAAIAAENLQVALQTSRQIGIAIGILMNSQKITEEQAFHLLRLASQCTHRKLRDVALDVVDTGRLDPTVARGRVGVAARIQGSRMVDRLPS